MRIVDKHGAWFTNFSQFRMHDPMSDTCFESGETVKATPTPWLEANQAVVKLTDEEGTPVDASETAAETAEVEVKPEVKTAKK